MIIKNSSHLYHAVIGRNLRRERKTELVYKTVVNTAIRHKHPAVNSHAAYGAS